MYENTLISLLPVTYEGLESMMATPTGDCKDGVFNSTACRDGEHFYSCGCGPAFGS